MRLVLRKLKENCFRILFITSSSHKCASESTVDVRDVNRDLAGNARASSGDPAAGPLQDGSDTVRIR